MLKLEQVESGRRSQVRLNEMIGNSLLKNITDAKIKEEDEKTKVNFVWKSGAKHEEVIEVLRTRVKKAKVNTDFALLLFQNSIRTLASMSDDALIEELENSFSEIRKIVEKQNQNGFYHRIAIAEEQFAPELFDYFGDIAFINYKINKENAMNNKGPFRLWKSQTKNSKKVKNEDLFLPKTVNNRWKEWQNSGRPGYHIGEGRGMSKFSQFIQRYFQEKRNWDKTKN